MGGWKGDRQSGESQQCKGRGTGWGAGWEHQGCLGMGLGEGAWRNCPALEAGRGMLQLVLPLQGGDGRLGKHPETGSERGRGWGVRWTPVMFSPPPPSAGKPGGGWGCGVGPALARGLLLGELENPKGERWLRVAPSCQAPPGRQSLILGIWGTQRPLEPWQHPSGTNQLLHFPVALLQPGFPAAE